MKKIAITNLIFLIIMLTISCDILEKTPISGITIQDVFGVKVNCSLHKKYDFGGVDIHGDIFILYEYDIIESNLDSIVGINRFKEYPKFEKGFFADTKSNNSNLTSKWKHFPMNNKFDSIMFNSTMDYLEVSRLVDKKKYSDTANYYSYISDRSIGNCFLLLTTDTKRLYFVRKTN